MAIRLKIPRIDIVTAGRPGTNPEVIINYGNYYKPTVSVDGTISWEYIKGKWDNDPEVLPVNIKGAQGAQGIQGIQGPVGLTGATGNGITSIVLTAGNHAAGTTDTYTITFTDGTTTTFGVYNGANPVVVNDLTTGGADKALSAEQGKTLSASISELNADVDFNVTNLVTNGDFSNGTTGWTAGYSTHSSALYTLSNTGNGTGASADEHQSIGSVVSGHKYYIKIKFRVTSSACVSVFSRLTFTVGTNTNVAIQNSPKINEWYTLSGVFSQTDQSGTMTSYLRHNYADAATANGKVMEVQYISAIDLTTAFGAGNEPSAAQMDAILAQYPNSWFDGTVNLAANPKMLPYLLNNIRALNAEKTGYGVYSGLGVTAQATPDMTVGVAAGIIYMDTGRRFEVAANTALAITDADATNPRIDIVYVNSSGVIAYLAGTAAASPSAPSVPTGGQKLAEISVAANATTIVTANIADRRKTLTGEAWITPTLINGWASISGRTVQYYKDNFGTVHFRGDLDASAKTATTAFTLPIGYRPSVATYVNIGNTNSYIGIASTGAVSLVSISWSWQSLSFVTFRAEA